jgi:hypothetical protein
MNPAVEILDKIAGDKALLEVGRLAIEANLIEWRDNRLHEFGRNNGLVVKEKDGTDSTIIRFGPETALRIGMTAIAKHLMEEKHERDTHS